MNLDSKWDSRVIESQNIILTELEASSNQKLKQVDFMAWMKESRALLPQVYIEGHKLHDA